MFYIVFFWTISKTVLFSFPQKCWPWVNSPPFSYFFVCDLINLHFPLSTVLCLYSSRAVSCHALDSINDREDQHNLLLWLPLLGRAGAETWAGGGFCPAPGRLLPVAATLDFLLERSLSTMSLWKCHYFDLGDVPVRDKCFQLCVSPRISSIPLWWLWQVTLPALGVLKPVPWGAWWHVPPVLWAVHFRFYGIVGKEWLS